MTKGKSNKKLLMIIIGIIIFVVAFILCFIWVMGERKLNEQLDLGEKYLSKLKYEKAIVAFEEAIKIEPKCVEAYVGLAQVYTENTNYEEAIVILNRGYEETGDESLLDALDEVESEKADYEKEQAQKAEEERLEKERLEQERKEEEERIAREKEEQERLEQERKEKEEAERLAKEEEERLREEERQRSEEVKRIYEWYILNMDIVKDRYEDFPVTVNFGEETEEYYTFAIVLGYTSDMELFDLVINKHTGICEVVRHQIYDHKSGMIDEAYDSKYLGKTYEFVINDEVKEKFGVYEAGKALFTGCVDSVNQKLDAEYECIGGENFKMGTCRALNVDDSGIVHGEIYYTMPYDFLTSFLVILDMELDTSTNVLTIVSHYISIWGTDYADAFRDELSGIDGWTMVIQ